MVQVVQQHRAHPWALSFLLLPVGQGVLEDQQVPAAQNDYFSYLVLDLYPPERYYWNKPKITDGLNKQGI